MYIHDMAFTIICIHSTYISQNYFTLVLQQSHSKTLSNNVYSIRAGTHVHFAGTRFPSYPPEDKKDS